MAEHRTIGDLVERGRTTGLVGRDRELEMMSGLLVPGGPAIAYLHGPYGIGKSALLIAFQDKLSRRGIAFTRIQGDAVEPQPHAVITAIAGALGATAATPAELGEELSRCGSKAILAIDDLDALRLVATWLRRELIPALPADMRLILVDRLPPHPVWIADYGELISSIRIGPIGRDSVLARAKELGLGDSDAQQIWNASLGHPLSMQMAFQASRAGVLDPDAAIGELADAVLTGSGGPALRRMAEIAAVVRRMTQPLLGAILDEEDLEAFDTFAALPFVQQDREGCHLAEPVRRAIAARLSSLEPDRYAALRLAAANWITGRLETVGPLERWRHMADLLYLVEHPQIRDAFFPPDSAAPPVEPAEQSDFPAVLAIAEERAGSGEAQIIRRWIKTLPHRFSVARGANGNVLAFYVYARGDDPLDEIAAVDPLLAHWRSHWKQHGVRGEVLFVRQLLTSRPGEGLTEWAACTLDLKRAYFERWDLARVYTAASPAVIAGPLLRRLGFQPLTEPSDGVPGSMRLDLPGAGLIGWISSLLGVSRPRLAVNDLAFTLDTREITVNGAAVQLTRLEAKVLAILMDRAPVVVPREELIETVWQRAFVGSNVVDAVVRTLRRKLGPESSRIRTVPKTGYRYVSPHIS